MDNKSKINAKNFKEVINETNFSADSLTAEIKPLFNDYFVGEFELEGNVIFCKFLNGQTFSIKTEEVKN